MVDLARGCVGMVLAGCLEWTWQVVASLTNFPQAKGRAQRLLWRICEAAAHIATRWRSPTRLCVFRPTAQGEAKAMRLKGRHSRLRLWAHDVRRQVDHSNGLLLASAFSSTTTRWSTLTYKPVVTPGLSLPISTPRSLATRMSLDGEETAVTAEPIPQEADEPSEHQPRGEEPMPMSSSQSAELFQHTTDMCLWDMFGNSLSLSQISEAARMGTPGFPMLYFKPWAT